MDDFEKRILQKIDNKEELTEDELSHLVYEFDKEKDYGENERWTRSVTTIVELCDRTFAVNWEEGLTEDQPDEFYSQPYEVELREYEKTITVREWVEK